jgi:thiol-disulfide isomerase/thioredoxin
LQLGEIAELKGDRDRAINEYLIAFVLPSEEGASVDRADVRRKFGNLWQLAHGSETGLGERILATYDQLNAESKSATASEANKDVRDPFEFVLRKVDGSDPLKMSAAKGKVVVLDFWATWCAPCREMAPMIGQVAAMFDGSKGDIVFLAVNDDEDESRVPGYLAKQKMHGTVVFADGLDTLLSIDSLPTIIVLDRNGKIAYRSDGFDPDSFVESLQQAILTALNAAPANIAPHAPSNSGH